MSLRVADLIGAMETIAPSALAAPWDNVGLLVGDPEARLSRVWLTIDLTREGVAEAAAGGEGGAVVAYHPVLFAAVKRLTAPSVAYRAAAAGLSVYSPHTALDVAAGGTNDVLADALGMTERRPLRRSEGPDSRLKLVTFVPAEHVAPVSRALFEAGAGRIGNYSACSFRGAGTGTFFGEAGANPVVGQAGQLEEAPELRLETVVPVGRAEAVVRALRASHPYEEPAFDLVRLAEPPAALGLGRVGGIAKTTLGALVERVKAALGTSHVLVAGDLSREVERAAVCAGAGGELLGDAVREGAHVLLTGELRHHDALRAVAAGVAVVATRHSVSERVTLRVLRERLAAALPGLDVRQSAVDRDPFAFA